MGSDWFDARLFPVPDEFRHEPVGPTPPTMLHGAELQLLKWLARSRHDGGALIDLGCWMGGSTAALVQGLRENPRPAVSATRVHTYDHFVWHPAYERYDLGFSCRVGDSFEAHFRETAGPWLDRVHLHAGDIVRACAPQPPIDVLFVDLMKDAAASSAVVGQFLPHVLPGRTLVIHQDFKHEWTYWIHLVMFRLRHCFAPVLDLHEACSTVFQAVAVPDQRSLKHAVAFESFSASEIDDAFDHSDSIVATAADGLRDEVRRARARAQAALKQST